MPSRNPTSADRFQRTRDDHSRENAEAPAAPQRTGPLRLLLVEDQPEVRETSRQLLELLGCEVQDVASAEAAEAALQRARFDVLLTDITLPGRSGLELARAAGALDPGHDGHGGWRGGDARSTGR